MLYYFYLNFMGQTSMKCAQQNFKTFNFIELKKSQTNFALNSSF